MLSRTIHLLTLIALFMLPLGMAHASAAPAMADHHALGGMGTMTPGHCDGTAPGNTSDHALPGDCAMACASALPALPSPISLSADLRLAGHLFDAPRIAALHGLILDIATPPPRTA